MRSLLLLVLVYGLACTQVPAMFSLQAVLDLLHDQAMLGFVVLGVSCVLIAGGLDLSVGAVLAAASAFVATRLAAGWSMPAAFAGAAGLGLAVGAVNGLCIDRLRLPPFLVTLATMFAVRGLALALHDGACAITVPAHVAWTEHKVLAAAWLCCAALLAWAMRHARSGRDLYALGVNEAAALLLGVPVRRARLLAYGLSGLAAAVAGIAFTLYGGSGDGNAATGLELDALAACVVGGVSLRGGRGTVLGAVAGVLILGTIQSALTFMGTLSAGWLRLAIGGVLLLFLAVQRLAARVPRRSAV